MDDETLAAALEQIDHLLPRERRALRDAAKRLRELAAAEREAFRDGWLDGHGTRLVGTGPPSMEQLIAAADRAFAARGNG